MSKRAASVARWWLADHQLLVMPRPPGGRQRPAGLPSVPGRPEGPALQLQHSGQLDLHTSLNVGRSFGGINITGALNMQLILNNG
jgi:hypothetical protein